MVQQDKKVVYMQTNMQQPTEGKFCDEYGNTMKPVIIKSQNMHIGYADKTDSMANSYEISLHNFKWKN
jgi:hypothetical protein